jgi:hypothetical protein
MDRKSDRFGYVPVCYDWALIHAVDLRSNTRYRVPVRMKPDLIHVVSFRSDGRDLIIPRHHALFTLETSANRITNPPSIPVKKYLILSPEIYELNPKLPGNNARNPENR